MLSQDSNEVLVREPGHRRYNPPEELTKIACECLEFAEMSKNVYSELLDPNNPGPPKGWTRLQSNTIFAPSIVDQARKTGLGFDVLENRSTPRVIAVVFRGTEFSWKDWKSNFRWFLRFIPFYKDQYTLTASALSQAIVDELAERRDAQELRIVSTGHSLGGGLSQHFAYSLPLRSTNGKLVPRVSHVYAFDPSPVTGWTTAGSHRTINADGLQIDRIFEHGEGLAYLRLLLSYLVPPRAESPRIREIRFNVVKSWSPLENHSIVALVKGLYEAVNARKQTMNPIHEY